MHWSKTKNMSKIIVEYQSKVRVDTFTSHFKIRNMLMVLAENCISYTTDVHFQRTSVFSQIPLNCYSPAINLDTMTMMSTAHRIYLGHAKFILLSFKCIQKSILWLYKYNLILSNPGRKLSLCTSCRLGISFFQFMWKWTRERLVAQVHPCYTGFPNVI